VLVFPAWVTVVSIELLAVARRERLAARFVPSG
jgi:hypothetical protein